MKKSLLTERQREVYELLLTDRSTEEIAEQLFIAKATVRNHIHHVMKQLGVSTRQHAIVELVRLGELAI